MTNRLLLGFFALLMLVGCHGEPAPVLPSATPMAIQPPSTATATFLPPPTVTPFPTATPRNGLLIVPEDETPALPTSAASSDVPLAPAASETFTPAPTASPIPPSPTLTPTVAFVTLPDGVSLEKQVYYSEFSSGWPSFNDPTAKITPKDGQYYFEIGPFDGRFLNTTAISGTNLYSQVEVTPEACPEKAGYGMMYHFKDASNYYLLTIFCDNTYTAIAKVGGSVLSMNYGKLPDGMDATKGEVHHIGVLAKDNTYTLYFDGKEIGYYSDSQMPKGDIAIYAVSQGAKVLKISFDNLRVWTVR